MLINLSAQLSFKIFSIFITALLSPGNSIFSPVSLYFTINAPSSSYSEDEEEPEQDTEKKIILG